MFPCKYGKKTLKSKMIKLSFTKLYNKINEINIIAGLHVRLDLEKYLLDTAPSFHFINVKKHLLVSRQLFDFF